MYGVGSIVNIKNIIFKTTSNKSINSIDHAYKEGRPCLIIFESVDKVYFLHQNSYKGKNYAHEIMLSPATSKKSSCINIRDINCRDIAFYKELTKLDDRELYNILN